MSEIALSVIIVLVFFFSPLILSIRALLKLKKINYLEEEIQALKGEVKKLKEGNTRTIPSKISIDLDVAEPSVAKVIEKPIEKKAAPETIVNVAPVAFQHKEKIAKKIKKKRNWNQERAFAFLGAFLGIIGLVFLTMYLGSIIGIFFRFMIMTGFSTLLLIISYPLSKKEKWEELSHISRSFSGALFLFAVFASSTIEGLKWIENPLLSLGVISAGTVYNLILGGLCRKKGYMVFHMAINFLVIFLLPAEPLVFWLAFSLTLGLQIFGYIRKEELNSGLSFLLFTLYALFYKETAADFLYFSWLFNFTAFISFINFTIFDKSSSALKRVISYAVPLLWIGSSAYLSSSKIEAIIPLLAGTLAGAILRVGKDRNLKKLLFWPLQILISGVLLILASGTGTQYWMVLLYMESSLFIFWIFKEQDYKSPPLLLNFLILTGSVLYLFMSNNRDMTLFTIVNRVLLISSSSFFMFKVTEKSDVNNKDFKTLLDLFQFLLPFWALLLSFIDQDNISSKSVLFFSFLSLLILYISHKKTNKVRSIGIWSAMSIPLVLSIYKLIVFYDISIRDNIYLIVPLLILSFILVFNNRIRAIQYSTDPGVYIFSFSLLVFLYFPFRQMSSILPGILVLLAAFLYYLWWEIRKDKDFQMAGTILLHIFFFRHVTHNLQLEQNLMFINIRFVIELVSLAVLYLYLKSSQWDRKMLIFQRTVFSISWLMILIVIFSHTNRNVLSLAFQLSAVVLLFIDRKKYLQGYPLMSLAYGHFVFAQLNLALNTHPSFPFLPGLLQHPWVFGFINLGSSVIVIYIFFRHIKETQSSVSPVFSRLKKITIRLMEKKNLSLLIPLFISLGLFFNWTLEETALTIALFSGCFILYGTALVLKENIFRHATSLALLATSVRLIFWDLAQSTMLAKSIAFLGASVIFILINILYSQFKGRFENV